MAGTVVAAVILGSSQIPDCAKQYCANSDPFDALLVSMCDDQLESPFKFQRKGEAYSVNIRQNHEISTFVVLVAPPAKILVLNDVLALLHHFRRLIDDGILQRNAHLCMDAALDALKAPATQGLRDEVAVVIEVVGITQVKTQFIDLYPGSSWALGKYIAGYGHIHLRFAHGTIEIIHRVAPFTEYRVVDLARIFQELRGVCQVSQTPALLLASPALALHAVLELGNAGRTGPSRSQLSQSSLNPGKTSAHSILTVFSSRCAGPS